MRFRLLLLLLVSTVVVSAQSFEDRFRSFQQQAHKEYYDFRDAANERYAQFLLNAWQYYRVAPAIPAPKEEPVPPVPYEEPVVQPDPQPIPYEEITPDPEPTPAPTPVAPVIENDDKNIPYQISFYGTNLSFRHPSTRRIQLRSLDPKQLSAAWTMLADESFDNLLYDCISARDNHQLCDWAYLTMLQQLSETIYGKSNEAVLLQAFLFANTGYQMRLAASKQGKLHLLVGSSFVLYDRDYFKLDGQLFFPLEDTDASLSICNGGFEKEQPLSLFIPQEQQIGTTQSSVITRKAQSGLTAQCSVNKNEIEFYNNYPTGQYGEDFGTRWAVYANTPLDESTKKTLYPALMAGIRGVPEAQAVNKLLNWVQTAFEYEYDDTIWGVDRAFFPSESLYYPYCDCEDRSILFSRIVRDLLGLDVVLLYYPGHLATAVNFHQDINGDYLVIKGKRYIICDPTYIGAPIGATMPGMDNKTAKVILL